MKRIGLTGLFLLLAVTASATLPVTRPWTTTVGTIPTADETQWAYNRSAAQVFKVALGGGQNYVEANDPSTDTAMHWTGDTFANNHYSEVVLYQISTTGSAPGQGHGPAVRMDTGTTQKTYVRLIIDSHGWAVRRFNNGAGATATTGTTAGADGETWRLTVVRSGANDIYTVTQNGALVTDGTITDTSPLSGGAAGIAHSSTNTASTGINSWTGGDVGGAKIGPIFFN